MGIDMNGDAALKEMWAKYRGWAARAREVKDGIDRGRWWTLILSVAAAILATLSSQVKPHFGAASVVPQVITGASAVIMAVVAYISHLLLDSAAEQRWIRSRALAETAKAESFKYVTKVPPYDGSEAGAALIEKLESLLASGADLPAKDVAPASATEGMPNHPLPIADYIKQRIEDQIDGYYRPRAAANDRKASFATKATQIFSLIAAILGAIGTMYPNSGIEVWVATIGTITGAISAYALGRHYQQLAASYRVTADRLALRLARWRIQTEATRTEAADRALVSDVEAVIAAETQAWMTELLSAHAKAPDRSEDKAQAG
jgi:protein-S-isoprenylcysteine O-methyltransferase Ste14